MSNSHRLERVNELIKEEISKILLWETKDPRLGMVTVTAAKVTADLHFAKVYVTFLGAKEERESHLEAIQHTAGYIRKLLGERVRIKYIPQITFVYDESLEYAQHIYDTLKELDIKSDE